MGLKRLGFYEMPVNAEHNPSASQPSHPLKGVDGVTPKDAEVKN